MRKHHVVLALGVIVALSAACTPAKSSPPSGALQVGICYTMVDLGESFHYLGPANALGNSLLYPDSTDCSTAPADNSQSAVLSDQADEAAAELTCESLLPGVGFLSSLTVLEPITPELDTADYWGCFVL